MRMLRLHQTGELVPINPAQIQTVYPLFADRGASIYFEGDDDALFVDESVEEIDRQISLN